MKILSVRLTPDCGPLRARIDVETPWGIRLYNVALKETASGWRAFPPQAFGTATATFTPDVASRIVEAAQSAIGAIRHDHRAA